MDIVTRSGKKQQFGLELQHVLDKILKQLQRVHQWQTMRYNRAALQLDQVYREIDQAGKPTLKHSFRATRKILKTYLFFPDFYFIIAGIVMVVFAAQLFAESTADDGLTRSVIFVLSSGFAVGLPLLITFVTLPPHILFRANIWGLALLNTVFSALTFSFIQPYLVQTVFPEEVLCFKRLIWPMLVFYGFTEFYLLMRLGPTIYYNKFLERHAKDSIERFIPADKRGPLMSLSAQDHYVEITTQNGVHLERMTIKRAVELVAEGAGIQVHRSHWVAFEAILDVEKTGERYAVLLRNGSKFPVGKPKVQALQTYLESR